MKTRLFRVVVSVVALILLVAFAGQAAYASGIDTPGLGRYIVTFDEGLNSAAKEALTRQFGGVVEEEIALIGNANVVLLPPPAVQALLKNGKVLRIEEDAVVTIDKKPTTPPIQPPVETTPWGIVKINADDVWTSSTGAGINIAVIDTGIDRDHPDLVGNIEGGENFVTVRGIVDPNKWDDDNGHGTHVAGIIAAIDNEIGVVGVSPGASLYAVKVLDKRGSGYISAIINGIDWCIKNGINVINMSLGASVDVQSFHDACDAARTAGIIIVAAAGNSGDSNPDDDVQYPARYDSVIAVAATDSNDERASWSSDGPEVDVAAPGVSIYSTYKGGSYATMSGTSMASPHAAGTVALMLAAEIPLTEIESKLSGTAHDLGAPTWYGAGLIDALAAVNAR